MLHVLDAGKDADGLPVRDRRRESKAAIGIVGQVASTAHGYSCTTRMGGSLGGCAKQARRMP